MPAIFRRLASLGITDLESHIKFETTFTPLSWRKRYNLMKGSTHGLCHDLTQLGYFRPGNELWMIFKFNDEDSCV